MVPCHLVLGAPAMTQVLQGGQAVRHPSLHRCNYSRSLQFTRVWDSFVLFCFWLCFCIKESNIFLPNRYIFNEKKRYINVCTFQFVFNYFNPKHLPENNIPFNMLWNKIKCDELGSWCFDLVMWVLATQSLASPGSLLEMQN